MRKTSSCTFKQQKKRKENRRGRGGERERERERERGKETFAELTIHLASRGYKALRKKGIFH